MKETRQQLERSRDDYRSENGMLHEALSAHMEGTAKRVGQCSGSDEHVGMWLVNPTRAHGGVVLCKSTVKGQTPMYRVAYLEDMHRDWTVRDCRDELAYGIRSLLGEAMVMRNKAIE